ncbi:MAG: alpha/beta hydrolase [Pseudomonadota bacterium]
MAALTLVLLPGMDGSGELFADFIAALGNEATPLVMFYPADQALGYEGLIDLVRTRLPAGQPFVLLGESFSGPVAIALAASHPPGLAGLILTTSFARNPVPLLAGLRRFLGAVPISASLSGLLSPFLQGVGASSDKRRSLRHVLGLARPAVLRARMDAVLAADFSDRMRNVTVPVLYLQAMQDRVVPAAAATHLLTLQPAMQVVAMRGPHLLLQAAPMQAAAAVRQFLTSLALT